MQPAIHAHVDVLKMLGRGREERHRIQPLFLLQHFLERVDTCCRSDRLGQTLAPVGAQIGDGGDDAVRMLVEEKVGAETAADDGDTDLAAGSAGAGRPTRIGRRALAQGGQASGAEQKISPAVSYKVPFQKMIFDRQLHDRAAPSRW